MTDYTKLIKALRYCRDTRFPAIDHSKCPYMDNGCEMVDECCEKLKRDAANAIEELQDAFEKVTKTAVEYQQRIVELKEQIPNRGEWIRFNNPNYSPFDASGEYLYQCNKCGKVVYKEYHYCPNCGSQMRGAQNE